MRTPYAAEQRPVTRSCQLPWNKPLQLHSN